ncbi:response regulator, partial [Staphylococcus epidermidis]|uniref:response regulator n=1 Tax=Staphylococcus epidermidis TaxID=1282 RepID=UPI00119DF2FD
NHLSKSNYDLHLVDNFQNIIQHFPPLQPQLLLLHINLPTLNPFHSSQQIPKLSHLPIIFITSTTHNIHQILPIQIPPHHFIHKPFNFSLTLPKIHPLFPPTYHLSIPPHQIPLKPSKLILHHPKLTNHNQHLQLSLTE